VATAFAIGGLGLSGALVAALIILVRTVSSLRGDLRRVQDKLFEEQHAFSDLTREVVEERSWRETATKTIDDLEAGVKAEKAGRLAAEGQRDALVEACAAGGQPQAVAEAVRAALQKLGVTPPTKPGFKP
jgi:hypothetical protein